MSYIGKFFVGAALFSLVTATGAAFAEDSVVVPAPTPVQTPVSTPEPILQPVQEPSNWDKFKTGAKQAGGAIADGTKNTARKVADGAAYVGEKVAEGYEEAKDYVKEKVD